MLDTTLAEDTILRLAQACGPGKTFSPSDAARDIAGNRSEDWGPLMQPLRRVAVALAKAGRVTLYRKGKPVDPDGFKGVYRIGAVRDD